MYYTWCLPVFQVTCIFCVKCLYTVYVCTCFIFELFVSNKNIDSDIDMIRQLIKREVGHLYKIPFSIVGKERLSGKRDGPPLKQHETTIYLVFV